MTEEIYEEMKEIIKDIKPLKFDIDIHQKDTEKLDPEKEEQIKKIIDNVNSEIEEIYKN